MKPEKWRLTEGHKAEIPAWNQRWKDIIMSTQAMDDEERRIVRDAVIGMYAAANLEVPRVVFVSSPLQAAVIAGAAAAWWHSRGEAATDAATYDATDAAATAAATYDATAAATEAAATRAAATAATAAAT
ncbi:MAG: hypothetical protein K2X38_08795, partial [Gemmataceae bacterium]|nr:hypothetical protein [Gemmataceae bacterium]